MDKLNYNSSLPKKMCSHCAAPIASNARFCPHCGSLQPMDNEASTDQNGGFSPTEELKVCPECQQVIRIGERVCPKCGKVQRDGIMRGIIIACIILGFLIWGAAIVGGLLLGISTDYEDDAEYASLYAIVQTAELPDIANEYDIV